MRNNRYFGEDKYSRNFEDYESNYFEKRKNFRIFTGVIIVVIGLVLLLKTLGIFSFFHIYSMWPVFMILVGLLIGIKHNFRNNAWWVLILVGIFNLIPPFQIGNHSSSELVVPIFVILAGIVVVFRPRKQSCFPKSIINSTISTEGSLDIEVIFGGRKELITTKNFQGGTISVSFGGCELNLSQADFNEPSVILDFRVSFGGVEMVVPSHWIIQNEIRPSFGNVEDERTLQTGTNIDTKKILILRGNVSFGNIEIKSY